MSELSTPGEGPGESAERSARGVTDHNRSSGGKGPPASLVGGNPVGMTGRAAFLSSSRGAR